jgi:adenylate cyclase
MAASPPRDAALEPSTSEVRAELERILRSRCFQQAGRASDFLRYVVEQTLAGEGARLKGYTIGVEVFGRPPDFDAQSDALVRVEAGRLRRRLVEYYASEGADDPVRIDLPRGSYVVDYSFQQASDDGEPAAPMPLGVLAEPRGMPWRGLAIAFGVLLVAALAVIAWQQHELLTASRTLGGLGQRERSELPRLVVMPFENLSNEPRFDALAASMTEEVMVVLDQLDLFVVATQRSWYGSPVAQPISRTATGGYVLTGSVRAGGDQARITVRLIEAESGMQLWTAAYDEPLAFEALPELQERVARAVAAVAAPYGPLFEAELARARRAEHTPELRDCLVMYYDYRRQIDAASYQDALLCFTSLSERKPGIVHVWAGLAMLRLDEFLYRFMPHRPLSLALAREATAKALTIDPNDFRANLALMRLQFFDGDPDFRSSIERTLALRPDSVEALAQAGTLLVISGDAATGLPLVERARALAPSMAGIYNFAYAFTYFHDEQYEAALAAAKQVDAPNWIAAHVILAAAAGLSGDAELARAAARRILELYPEFEREARKDFKLWHLDKAQRERFIAGLEAAGLEVE